MRNCTWKPLIIIATASVAACGNDVGGSLTWQPCKEIFECSTLSVPLDYEQPRGEKVQLALIRATARDPNRRLGVILANPGGPGVSGVEMAEAVYPELLSIGRDLTDRFDLVAFDPRGVGQSTAIDCVGGDLIDATRQLDTTADNSEEWLELHQVFGQLASGCADRGGRLAEFLATTNTARDMDQIRRALGEDQISYVGFSYGTYVGATYATLFPERIRAFVLDAVEAPFSNMEVHTNDQAVAYEQQLERFFDNCGVESSCPFHGGQGPQTLGDAFDDLSRRTDIEPLPTTDGRPLSQSDLLAATQSLLRSGQWTELAESLTQAEAGRGDRLLEQADSFYGRNDNGDYSNFIESFYSIFYSDLPCLSTTTRQLELFVEDVRTTAPRIGAHVVATVFACPYWPVRPGPPMALHAPSAPRFLLVRGANDPATPYHWAGELAEALGNGSHLMTYTGEGHVALGRSFCAIEAVIDYLVDPSRADPPAECGPL